MQNAVSNHCQSLESWVSASAIHILGPSHWLSIWATQPLNSRGTGIDVLRYWCPAIAAIAPPFLACGLAIDPLVSSQSGDSYGVIRNLNKCSVRRHVGLRLGWCVLQMCAQSRTHRTQDARRLEV